MNYENLYFKFIEKWKRQQIPEEVYTEVHHIIPKHCGGGDEEENLVRLTYRQHTFAHKILWKAYKKPQDLMCWRLMSAIEEDKKFALAQMAGRIGGAKNRDSGHISRVGKKYGPINGKANVESGLLDKIRHLANNDKQLAWAKKLGNKNVESGQIDRAREAALKNLRENGMSDRRKEVLDRHNEKMANCPKQKEHLRNAQKVANNNRIIKARERSASVIKNAERNEEYLKIKPRGKYWYISPEGLKFGTSIAAANYYGNVKDFDIQNWCKREQFGWRREEEVIR